MQIKTLFLLSLLLGSLGLGESVAQSISDSTEYRNAKLGIWCQTVSFIYQDHDADSLIEELNCQSWDAFRESISPNRLQVNSFFQTIEKPAIYAGYTSFDAKVQKLIEEIGVKLRSSPGRRQDTARLQKVDSLQQALQMVAASPEAYPAAGEEEVVEEAPEQPVSIAREERPAQPQRADMDALTEAEEEAEADWSEWLQWALLLLLAAAVGYLWVQNRKLKRALHERMRRRKQEIEALSMARDNPIPETRRAPEGVSRKEVLALIRAETEKLRQQQKMQPQETAAARPSEHKPKQKAEPVNEPVKESPAPEPLAPSAVKGTTKKEETKAPGLYYDKLPFKGGFHQNQLSSQRHPDSIYSIQLLKDRPDEAEFWVTEDQEVQKYAMQNGLSFFEEACEYNQVEENPSRVRNLEKGRLRKSGHLWEIEKKVKVNFE